MSTQVKPRVFHLATTKVVDEHREFLAEIGAPEWTSDAEDDHSLLTELAGRSCYMSFGTGLNKNVTRVRNDNHSYVGSGILGSKHGSVLEHSSDTFAIVDVSRIVTHELVRHRQGTGFSQESGRFVRVDSIRYYMPEALQDENLLSIYHELVEMGHVTEDFEWWAQGVRDKFVRGMDLAEQSVYGLESDLGLDLIKDFGKKKKLQSAVRRVAPSGMANTIVMTGNHRAWRHIVSVRTDSSAEEEIRLVQWMIFQRLAALHPAIYQDAIIVQDETSLPSNVPVVKFANEKV